jgi:diphosphomevalonate decarboxylase
VLACSTIDAGANVHVICPASSEPQVAAALEAMPEVEELIRDRVGTGPTFDHDHLF